jgi:MoxR-like ATPase
VASFIARLVNATHAGQSAASEGVKFGASPRAALGLASAAKARAMMEGRLNASFEDVRAVALPVLRHRVLMDYTAKLEGITPDVMIRSLLEEVPAQEKPLPTSLKAAKVA